METFEKLGDLICNDSNVCVNNVGCTMVNDVYFSFSETLLRDCANIKKS